MTIKEIAKLCEVDESTVWRWSKNVNCMQNASSLQNLDTVKKSGHGKAADLPVEIVVSIIRAGGREAPSK
jgi:hypothetical protein